MGACLSHSDTCGAGIGIFLRLRDCEILLLTTVNRGTFISSPYLDKWGESDLQLKRGWPLYLNNDQYRKIRTLWLEHKLHSTISKHQKLSTTLKSTNWMHL